MQFVADLHIHSKYSRATSKDLDIEHLVMWAKKKGIHLLGTGDFTHHLWLEELKSKLEPAEKGLFINNGVRFVLSCEISNIYTKKDKGYRVHTIILAPGFKTVDKIIQALSARGANLNSDGRPILGMDLKEMARIILDIDENCFLIPAHAWTPWFSVFGSNSGFNSIEECFEELSEKIFCIETGLSSDPAMNWRLSTLDRITLISNSDAHSPSKIGRECNVFNCELSYNDIIDTLKKKDKNRFLYTVEFYPEEGKYHYDGHRLCKVCLSPEESKKNNNLCPSCGRRLTLGVVHRVNELADRPEGFVPEGSIPFKNRIPLEEIIGDAKGMGVVSQAVQTEYEAIISKFGNEFDVLSNVPRENLLKSVNPRIAEGILRVREGKVNIAPGYDGEYGKIKIFKENETSAGADEQLKLF
ncbi:MAG TPA: endonuclease Q family protein [Candidatus Omnitrophota bacterium]|nr:endonuclease Q family protein [Candidatus Omnitrophota bacterium]HPD84497.1 endonuclease Q family protein [Candidatus Omnitrophota bacterium]HRZ03355.1 endonuclease Q family protein [Candidatus Omnitrophota bacterium]